MTHSFLEITDPSAIDGLTWAGPQLASDPDLLVKHAPDAHWVAIEDASARAVARCSLWWKQVPQSSEGKLGVIGHYAAESRDAGACLLEHACRQFALNDCQVAVGPMDGNTWRSYRLVSDPGSAAPFFMEPQNPATWPEHFLTAQFAASARYSSALVEDLARVDPRIERTRARLGQNGIRIRAMDPDRFEAELEAIFEVSIASFQNNYLYTPISRDEFIEQYRPVEKLIRPELVALAFADHRPVGFVFALPDLLQARRGEPVTTVILKTVAVSPGRASAGLGSVLVARVHEEALRLGFKKVVHALMHENNNSKNISAHYAKPMRAYALYSRRLP
jgi:GNAT superfamily N-acetyltransferase